MKQRIIDRSGADPALRPKSSPMRRKIYNSDITDDLCTTSDDSLQRPPRRGERSRPPKSWDDSGGPLTPGQQWAAAGEIQSAGPRGRSPEEIQSDGGRQKLSYKKRRQMLLQAQTGQERSGTPDVGFDHRGRVAPPELMRCFSEEDRPMAHAMALQHQKPTLVDVSSQTTKTTSKLHLKPPHNIFARFGWKASDRSTAKSTSSPVQAKGKAEECKLAATSDSSKSNAQISQLGPSKLSQSKISTFNRTDSDEGIGKTKRVIRQRSAGSGLGRISEDSMDGTESNSIGQDSDLTSIPNGGKALSRSVRRGSDRVQNSRRFSKQRYLGSEVGLYATSPSSDEGYKDDDDAISTHSDIPAFRRNDGHRSSLPVVGTPNKSRERPLGLVFLTFRNETKRGLLPNEITAMSTVWALFVRAFSDQLSMEWFEMSNCTVCILDKQSSVYSRLKDLNFIRDRSVLKIFEDGDIIPGVDSNSLPCNQLPYTIQSQPNSRCQSPPQNQHDTGKHRADTQLLDYTHQSGCHSNTSLTQDHFSEELSRNQDVESLRETSERMRKMETQLASLAAVVQNTVLQQQHQQQQQQHEMLEQQQRSPQIGRSRRSSVLSSYSANSDVSQCTVRQMTPGLDQPVRPELQMKLKRLLGEVSALKAELTRIRQMHQVQAVLHKESIYKTFVKIKEAIDSLPNCSVEKSQLDVLEAEKTKYIEEAFAINNALKELEGRVEELRSDVVSRRCDVDLGQVENTTTVLGQVGRLLSDHKNKLQILLSKMKSFVAPKENFERLTREEQCEMDKLLDRWKHLAGTLATLKKLAVVQRNSTQSKPVSTDVATGQNSVQKHRSILHKPQQYLPASSGESEGEAWSESRPSVPLCPEIFVNDAPISPTKPPHTTPTPHQSSPGPISSKLKQNVAFLLSSTDTSDKQNGIDKRIPTKPNYRRSTDSTNQPNKDMSPNSKTKISNSVSVTENGGNRNTSGNIVDSNQPDGSSFFTPKRLPPEPPVRKYLNLCPTSGGSSGSNTTPNFSDGVAEENGDDDVFSQNEADFDAVLTRSGAPHRGSGRGQSESAHKGQGRSQSKEVGKVRPQSAQARYEEDYSGKSQLKGSQSPSQGRRFHETIEQNYQYNNHHSSAENSVDDNERRGNKSRDGLSKTRPSSAGTARTSIPSSSQRSQTQSRVPKPTIPTSSKRT